MCLSESLNKKINGYVPCLRTEKFFRLLGMENIFIYDLETYTDASGELKVYAMGVLSLESVVKSKKMRSVLRSIKYGKEKDITKYQVDESSREYVKIFYGEDAIVQGIDWIVEETKRI